MKSSEGGQANWCSRPQSFGVISAWLMASLTKGCSSAQYVSLCPCVATADRRATANVTQHVSLSHAAAAARGPWPPPVGGAYRAPVKETCPHTPAEQTRESRRSGRSEQDLPGRRWCWESSTRCPATIGRPHTAPCSTAGPVSRETNLLVTIRPIWVCFHHKELYRKRGPIQLALGRDLRDTVRSGSRRDNHDHRAP